MDVNEKTPCVEPGQCAMRKLLYPEIIATNQFPIENTILQNERSRGGITKNGFFKFSNSCHHIDNDITTPHKTDKLPYNHITPFYNTLNNDSKRLSESDIFQNSNIENRNQFRNRAVTVCIASSNVSNTSPKMSARMRMNKTQYVGSIAELQIGSMEFSNEYLRKEKMPFKHTLKGKLTKLQRLLDKAFGLMDIGDQEYIIEGANMITKIIINAWMSTNIGRDLAYGLCDYIRLTGYLDIFLDIYLNENTNEEVRRASGRVLEGYLDPTNRRYLCTIPNRLNALITMIKHSKEGESQRIGISILETLFNDNTKLNEQLIDLSALDYVLSACQVINESEENNKTLRHVARALANLSLTSDNQCQQKLIDKNVPDWLYLLASSRDIIIRYYACLAICVLGANKELESVVLKSGTLALVEPFLSQHSPSDFAMFDSKYGQGECAEWLQKLVPLLSAKRSEPRSMAAFHLAMEAGLKKTQGLLNIFQDISVLDNLRQVASLPEELAPKFAILALEIIGEKTPYKLSRQVALWAIEDVQYWIRQIGFEVYAEEFSKQKVDGDLLLLLSDSELANDIGMTSSLARKRFMRELDSLKIVADYGCLDGNTLDRYLTSIDARFSIYTYKFLDLGIDCSTLSTLDDEILKINCGISNPVHRRKMLQSMKGCHNTEDMEIAVLKQRMDIFISYRRSTGGQLASLLKVLLQLRGYKVFIDIDRLYAGKFDCSLLKNIQAAKHFILVLTAHALDRCLDDQMQADWVHKEIACAIQHNKNVIPLLDPDFQWPDEHKLPDDIRMLTKFNGVRWVHEYQDACIAKMEKFISGQVNINLLKMPKSKIKTTSNVHRTLFGPCLSYCPRSQLDFEEKDFWTSTQRSRANTLERTLKSPISSAKIILHS